MKIQINLTKLKDATTITTHANTAFTKKNCLSEKQKHRTITENCGRLERAMFFKMEKEEYKEEFSKNHA